MTITLRKGHKKGYCIRHGKLTEPFIHYSHEKVGLRKRCSRCRNAKSVLQRVNRSVEEIRIYETSRHKKLTIAEYEKMFFDQDNKCAICKKPESRRIKDSTDIARLCVDHCHSTGKIRGLLCHACNTAIGKFKDDVSLLMAAIEYLRGKSQ